MPFASDLPTTADREIFKDLLLDVDINIRSMAEIRTSSKYFRKHLNDTGFTEHPKPAELKFQGGEERSWEEGDSESPHSAVKESLSIKMTGVSTTRVTSSIHWKITSAKCNFRCLAITRVCNQGW